jgi:23S rRNA (guanosine2251-2'-O)-methyltransferase
MRKLRNHELDRKSAESFLASEKIPVKVVLDQVRSLYNVGSIFRTCDAFLVEEIILVGITAVPPNKEIDKTALGATETVKWVHFPDADAAIQYLKTSDVSVYIVEQTSDAHQLSDFIIPEKGKMAVVFGHEVKGVANIWLEHAEGAIEIPMEGTKHSFNVGVAAGIVLWELFKQIRKK